MESKRNEKLAFFAFSFVVLAIGGPCGAIEKYFTIGNVTVTELPGNGSQNGANVTHMGCENFACVQMPGAGADQCAFDSDCMGNEPLNPPPASQTHLACQNQACAEVSGSGADECATDADCVSAQPPPTQPPAQQACAYTDCSSCLKTVPGQCKWCIEGSVCTSASDSTSVCTFGPTAEKWLTQDYQCNLATR